MANVVPGMNYAIGVNSQNGEIPDVLANPKQCALDAPLMKTLLVNTIRVYIVDNTQDHTECMHTFEKNGIYVIIDLPTYKTTIDNVRYTAQSVQCTQSSLPSWSICRTEKS